MTQLAFLALIAAIGYAVQLHVRARLRVLRSRKSEWAAQGLSGKMARRTNQALKQASRQNHLAYQRELKRLSKHLSRIQTTQLSPLALTEIEIPVPKSRFGVRILVALATTAFVAIMGFAWWQAGYSVPNDVEGLLYAIPTVVMYTSPVWLICLAVTAPRAARAARKAEALASTMEARVEAEAARLQLTTQIAEQQTKVVNSVRRQLARDARWLAWTSLRRRYRFDQFHASEREEARLIVEKAILLKSIIDQTALSSKGKPNRKLGRSLDALRRDGKDS